jgi:pimeloyl-ACP methyl ester carboxylesterase
MRDRPQGLHAFLRACYHVTSADIDKMPATACTRMLGYHTIDGAGHWVQQEQPEATRRLLLDFLRRAA